MTPDVVDRIAKYAGGAAAIGLGVLGLWHPPFIDIDRAFAGALIAGGFGAFGFNVGTVAAAPVAAVRSLRRSSPDPPA